jgi:hypothetical protein
MSLELGERHLDRIEVRALRRQEEEPSSALLEGSACDLMFVSLWLL